ncbi:MAG: ABC transporter ATP-binding protein [Phyllobacterium sp.]
MSKVIEVRNLSRVFAGRAAVDNVSFDVNEGEVLVIVGSSGCGKTTTLRCIAGLTEPTSGTVTVDGKVMVGPSVFVPPEKRGIGMVFQSYALWPHKTVAENIAYSLIVRGTPKAEIGKAVDRALALVDLKGMGDRYPSSMSGGQQQRVAVARCAVSEPRVLLLDEPLSNLDAKLREQMREELRYLITKIRSTAIHITHDQAEAMALADRIICMRDGKVEQVGSARDLYRRPASRFIADFIGISTFLEGTCIERGHDSYRIALTNGDQLLSSISMPVGAGSNVTVAIRPENFNLHARRPEGINVLEGTISSDIFFGDHIEYSIAYGGGILKTRSRLDFPVGAAVFVQVDPDHVVYFGQQSAAAAAA